MPTIKPEIFIGSSTEALAIAQSIASECNKFAHCHIWTKQFQFGHSFLEDLVDNLSLYDYAILIGTADDKTRSRGETMAAARDNILFEFGLFVGRLGRERAFLVAEDGIRIPSDLKGISLPYITNGQKHKTKLHPALIKAVKNVSKDIGEHIAARQQVFPFGYLPSTALASGYYNNFVEKVLATLLDGRSSKVGSVCHLPNAAQHPKLSTLLNMPVKDVCLTVCIPEVLSPHMFAHVKQQEITRDWWPIKISAGTARPFDFHVHAHKSRNGMLHLLDVPLTLNALWDATSAYVHKSHVGRSAIENRLQERELRTFKNVLRFLADENPVTRDRIQFQTVK